MQQTSISQDWSDYNEPTQSNILIPGLIASPCKHHPSFDGPCPRLDKYKDHPACENCGPRQVGYADCWNPLTYVPRPVVQNPKVELKPCMMPECGNMTSRGYCQRCTSRRNGRKGQWKRAGNDGEAPEWFLNRKIENKERVPKKCTNYNYHPDDAPHRAILDYPEKLKRAESMGYRSYKEMTIQVYEKHKSLRKAGEELGMSWGGLRSWFRKIGHPLVGIGGSNNVKRKSIM